MRGADNSLYSRARVDGQLQDYVRIGGTIADDPSVDVDEAGQVSFVVEGQDGVYRWTEQQRRYTRLLGEGCTQPDSDLDGDLLAVVCRGTSDELLVATFRVAADGTAVPELPLTARGGVLSSGRDGDGRRGGGRGAGHRPRDRARRPGVYVVEDDDLRGPGRSATFLATRVECDLGRSGSTSVTSVAGASVGLDTRETVGSCSGSELVDWYLRGGRYSTESAVPFDDRGDAGVITVEAGLDLSEDGDLVVSVLNDRFGTPQFRVEQRVPGVRTSGTVEEGRLGGRAEGVVDVAVLP